MYLKLIFISFVFICWPYAAKAQTTAKTVPVPDTHSNSAPVAEVHSSLPIKAPDEVTLEANVVQIILNDEHRVGVDWGAIVSDFHTVPLKQENDLAWNDKKYRLSFGTVSQDDYAVLLDALDTVGKMSQFPQLPVKIIAGTPANISFAKQDIHVGLLLSRLKTGELSLRIDTQIPGLLHAPTSLLVANDTTIVIGGLIKEEEITRKRKFFLLGDIPIFGLVFRYKGRLMQRTETVIFLTERTKAVEAPKDEE